VYYTTNLGKIMAIPDIPYSSPGLGQLLSNQDSLQGMRYQAPSTNMFKGSDLDNFVKTDFSSSTGSNVLDTFKPSTGGVGAESSPFGDLFKDEFAISNYATLGGLALNLLGYGDRKRAMEQQLAQGKIALDDAKSDLAFKRNKRANLNKLSGI
jgi:hypothetical protein